VGSLHGVQYNLSREKEALHGRMYAISGRFDGPLGIWDAVPNPVNTLPGTGDVPPGNGEGLGDTAEELRGCREPTLPLHIDSITADVLQGLGDLIQLGTKPVLRGANTHFDSLH
jgi:hypothetical protein